MKEEERDVLELDFGDIPQKLKGEFLDMYEGIQSEILSTAMFNENSDLSTTYVGKVDTSKISKIKAEESFLISKQGYTVGKLLDGTKCQALLDTGASRSFMSMSHYLCCKSLHSLPIFASRTQRIQMGNGQFVCVLFIIPIIIDIHRHRFKIHMLVLEIHENIDLVLGIKNISELKGVINSWDCCFNFLNRSLPIFPKECILLKPKEQKLIKVEASFIDEISGLAIIKILDKPTHSTMMLKLKFTWNSTVLDISTNGLDTIIFGLEEVIGILDLRSLGYDKIKQGILQQKLKQILQIWKGGYLCEQFIKFINTLRKERQQEDTKEKYTWLDPSNERKYMTYREIIEWYIDLEKLCLMDRERKEVMGMLYKYKEAFSLRDEIGICPYIEVDIDITDKSPFLLDFTM